jgi:hypothetical protein
MQPLICKLKGHKWNEKEKICLDPNCHNHKKRKPRINEAEEILLGLP